QALEQRRRRGVGLLLDGELLERRLAGAGTAGGRADVQRRLDAEAELGDFDGAHVGAVRRLADDFRRAFAEHQKCIESHVWLPPECEPLCNDPAAALFVFLSRGGSGWWGG